MVGGGSRRDEGGPMRVGSNNVFAALDSLRKKKKAVHSKGTGSSKAASSKGAEDSVFWAPTPLTVKSWADVDDDDDYFATTAPPPVWGATEGKKSKESAQVAEEESESEDDILLDDGDEDMEDEHEHETEAPPALPEHIVKKPILPSAAPKEAERQLSKKELKKKELAELEAVLAEFRVSDKDSGENAPEASEDDKKQDEQNGAMDKSDNVVAPAESKTSKKKKKKEKASKDAKDSQDQLVDAETPPPDETVAYEQTEPDSSAVDVKERLKKMASVKKKKTGKEMDSAAKAAATEAAARSARLAAAKKKEKSQHYNQQPVR